MPLEIIRYVNAVQANFKATQKGVLKAVVNGASIAKSLCAVDKGQARNSIGYSADVDGQEVKGGYNQSPGEKTDTFLESKGQGTTGYYGSALDYFPWLESGTLRMVAQPSIGPSAEILKGQKTAAEVKQEMNKEFQAQVQKGTKATRIIR